MTIIVRENGNATHVEESGVQDEGRLQRFIFDNLDSLPLSDIKEGSRLMVVGREFPTSSGPIDVLAIDADGDIYVVETKLYKNPDKRRVIAQLLDYGAALWRGYRNAANFVTTMEAMVNKQAGTGLLQQVMDFFELDDEEGDEVIRCVTKNLSDGNFKFIVLMDQLDSRLRDLIVFLNQRSQFDVYAVSIQFYRHEQLEIVIPKLFGAEIIKEPASTGQTRGWNEGRFFEAAKETVTPTQLSGIKRLYEFSQQFADKVRWARGKQGAFRPQFKQPYKNRGLGRKIGPLFTVNTDGVLTLKFGTLSGDKQLEDYRDRFALKLRELSFEQVPDHVESESVLIPLAVWEPRVDEFIRVLREVFAIPQK